MAPEVRSRMPVDRLARIVAVATSLVCSAGTAAAAVGQEDEMIFFRIATGGVNGTYHPIGAIIGNAISTPQGSRPCAEGGSCGVYNLIAAAVSSHGSVANVEAIEAGMVESGFAQADVVHDAFYAEGAFSNRRPMRNLRVIANLYPERMQVVVRAGAGIASVRDLPGRRVSLDDPGSGTLPMARMVLRAYGIDESGLTVDFLKAGPAAARMQRGELDAFFFVAGVPTNVVADLLLDRTADLVPLEEEVIGKVLAQHPFLSASPIPADTYRQGDPEVPSIGVGAQWIVAASIPDDRVYAICRALWNDATRALLDVGHPAGRQIRLETALAGIDIPVHPGALRCYEDLGIRP